MFYFSQPWGATTDRGGGTEGTAGAAKDSDFLGKTKVVSRNKTPLLLPMMNNTNDVRSSGNYNCNTTRTGMGTTEREDLKEIVNETDRIRLASFVPWSRGSWSRDEESCSVVSPLVEMVAKRKGKRKLLRESSLAASFNKFSLTTLANSNHMY